MPAAYHKFDHLHPITPLVCFSFTQVGSNPAVQHRYNGLLACKERHGLSEASQTRLLAKAFIFFVYWLWFQT